MATRKSTTAKTKMTKTTAKARTSKVSTKVTAVKAVAKQAPKVQANRLAFLSLQRLWTGGLVLFVLLAVLAVFLMQPAAYTLTQTHLTRDVLLSHVGTTFVSASHAVMDVQLRWLLVALLGLSAIFPVLYLTRLKDYYADRVQNRRVFLVRWVDLALGSTLMLYIIALLCGYSDIATLKLIGTAMVATCGLGWIAEQQNEGAKRPVWSAFGLSIFTGAMPWLLIGLAKVSTLVFGDVRSPWYTYALCITALVGSVLLAVNQWKQHRREGEWADYSVVERNYALISTATKVVFAVILIAGLKK